MMLLLGLLLGTFIDSPWMAACHSPDGTQLALARRGEVLLFDAEGHPLKSLTIPEPKITAMAMRGDGLLVVASTLPGQKGFLRVFQKDATKPSLTMTAHKDVIHEIAFSPDGKLLATCGYDKLVSLWDVGKGIRTQELKDHADSVYGISFSPDGKLLASVAADRAVKVWDVETGKRLYTLGESTDWLYTVAFSPDGNYLAAGGVDKSIRVWKVNAQGGMLERSAFAHDKGVLKLLYTSDGKQLVSVGEDNVLKVWNAAKLTEEVTFPRRGDTVLGLSLAQPQNQLLVASFDGQAGVFDLKTGKELRKITPATSPIIQAMAGNDLSAQAQALPATAYILGKLERPGQLHYYSFNLAEKEELGIRLLPIPGSKFQPIFEVRSTTGEILTQSKNGLLGFTATKAGKYLLTVRDGSFGGSNNFDYRLQFGKVPVVLSSFPLVAQPGKTNIVLDGVNLPKKQVLFDIPMSTAVGSKLPVPDTGAVNPPTVVVGEFKSHVESTLPISIPRTVNGKLSADTPAQTWSFSAKKGVPVVVEVEASRLGSNLDSTLEILDAAGKPVEQAVLRAVARTYSTLRDRGAGEPGLRLENWSDFLVNDYVYAGTELIRVVELPKGPDEDTRFWSLNNKRVGYMGTTPRTQPMSAIIYKVEVYPAGTALPPNGFPTFPLYYRNDDGGQNYGADAKITFVPPADGTYQARIADAQNRVGAAYAIHFRPQRPDFRIKLGTMTPGVWKKGAIPFQVTCERLDDFNGPINLRFAELPTGFTAPDTHIPELEEFTSVAMAASEEVEREKPSKPFKVIASATIHGKLVSHETVAGVPTVRTDPDILIELDQKEVTITPGGEAKITVKITRQNKFAGRIPIEVRGLPLGVVPTDVGLNGILITEKEDTRTFTIRAEPWVQPGDQPIVVLAKREGKNTEHAGPSVLLKIRKAGVVQNKP